MRSMVSPKNLSRTAELLVGWEYLDHVAANAIRSTGEAGIVAVVENAVKLPQHAITLARLAALDADDDAPIILGRSQTVDARHTGDDQHVVAREQRSRG